MAPLVAIDWREVRQGTTAHSPLASELMGFLETASDETRRAVDAVPAQRGQGGPRRRFMATMSEGTGDVGRLRPHERRPVDAEIKLPGPAVIMFIKGQFCENHTCP